MSLIGLLITNLSVSYIVPAVVRNIERLKGSLGYPELLR